jgi:hypothetical protein
MGRTPASPIASRGHPGWTNRVRRGHLGGAHVTELSDRFTLEHVPPQLVRLKVEGELGGNDIHAIFERIEPWIENQPFWLFEIDISGLSQATVEARRAAAERIGKTPAYAMALVGGSLAQRALATLFLKLSELFSGNRDIAHKFLKDGPSARAWLLEEARRRTVKER